MKNYRKISVVVLTLVFLLTMVVSPLAASASASAAAADGKPKIYHLQKEYNPGGGFGFYVDTRTGTTVKVNVYDSTGKHLIAEAVTTREPQDSEYGITRYFEWDCKPMAGNDLKLPIDQYVPATAGGTTYNVQVVATKSGITTKSSMMPFKIVLKPILAAGTSFPSGYIIGIPSKCSFDVWLNTTVKTSLTMGIYSKNGSILYAEIKQDISTSGDYALDWDGKATKAVKSQNIKVGNYLPASAKGTQYLVKATATNSYGTATIKNTLALYTKGSISNVKVDTGFVVGFPDKLKITAKIKGVMDGAAIYIYTADGKKIASIGANVDRKGVVTNYWDGKYPDYKGKYIDAAPSGTTYKLRVGSSEDNVYSPYVSFKVYPAQDVVKKVTVPVKTFKATKSGTHKAKIGIKLSRAANAQIYIYDSNYKKVYAKLSASYIKANSTKYFYWNGKVVDSTESGLGNGTLVPAGKYRIKVFAGGKVETPDTVITVKR